MKKKTPRLGAVTDDPHALLDAASKELASKTFIAQRQAAEKAHLAMSSSLEVATRKPIRGRQEEIRAIETIAKRARDPELLAEYKQLRQYLHSDCFHQDKCGAPGQTHEAIGQARSFVNRVLRAGRRQRGQR